MAYIHSCAFSAELHIIYNGNVTGVIHLMYRDTSSSVSSLPIHTPQKNAQNPNTSMSTSNRLWTTSEMIPLMSTSQKHSSTFTKSKRRTLLLTLQWDTEFCGRLQSFVNNRQPLIDSPAAWPSCCLCATYTQVCWPILSLARSTYCELAKCVHYS